MSALSGVWHKDGAPGIGAALGAMNAALSEWLCDAPGEWENGAVGLAQRVRFTTPESLNETQPFAHLEIPELVIAADAWLDNRTELCDALGIAESERGRLTDSALILRAYVKWGEACAGKLRGDFAFAIWDGRAQKIYCARDYLGFKPFIYYDAPNLFTFSSDVRGVLGCPGVPVALDASLLAASLVQFTHRVEQSKTFYRDVVKLPPAHFLVVTRESTRLEKYWSPEDAPSIYFKTDDAYAEQCRVLLEQAVTNATRSNFRVGAHLSGGLDSTAIAVLMARNLRARGETTFGYSWSPPPEEAPMTADDERHFIDEVSAREGITTRYLSYSAEDIAAIYTRDMTRIPTESIVREEQIQAQAADDGLRVLLSGWGGDDVVSHSGRGYLGALARQGKLGTLHRGIVERIPREFHGPRRARAYGGIFYRNVMWALAPDALWLMRPGSYAARVFDPTFIHPDLYRRQRAAILEMRDPIFRDSAGVRAAQTKRLEGGHLTRRIESWATHGAKRGLVYRYPLLDKRLVEFCLGVPGDQYFAEGRSRALLRRATRGLLPESLRSARTKTVQAALGVVGETAIEATRTLFSRTRTQFSTHPAALYVDAAKLERWMDAGQMQWTQSQSALIALSYFYIKF